MLAVVFGCKRFHTYVYGKHFTVESDHKPLEMIAHKNLSASPPRLQRMLMEIQGYDVRIMYRPGKEMILADSLSRLPNKNNDYQIDLDLRVQFIQFSDDKLSNLKKASLIDPELSALRHVIFTGWPDSYKKVPTILRPYWSFRDELSIEDALILKGGRIIIPETMKEEILKNLHYAHQGIEKCKLRAKFSVYWTNINDDIEKLIKSCQTCQKYQRSQQPETLIQTEIPAGPWQTLGSDIFHLDGDTYLLVADYYSKFPVVKKMSNTCTSKEVVGVLKSVFSEQGAPQKLYTDNGPQYSSDIFKKFAKQWNFIHITSSPHFAQANGFSERMVQTVKKCHEES